MTEQEHPILYTTANVRLVQKGLKTMTRRVAKPQPSVPARFDWRCEDGQWRPYDDLGNWLPSYGQWRCPYGEPGHWLWTRERLVRAFDGERAASDGIRYAVDNEPVVGRDGLPYLWEWERDTLPSIHMPRWVCRTRRPVESIGVEQVQEISEADAMAEGCCAHPPIGIPAIDDSGALSAVGAFAVLWNSINAAPKRAKRNPYTREREDCFVSYPWEAVRETRERRGLPWYVVGNPHVWVVGFGGKPE